MTEPVLAPRSRQGGAKAAAIAAAAAAAIGVAVWWQGDLAGLGGGDSLSAEQQQRIAASFAAASATLVPVALDDPAERTKAQGALDLPEPQARQVMADAQAQRVRLSWIQLSDNFDQDGDVVRLSVGSYSRVVQLWNAPAVLAIPVPVGTPVVLSGVRDGGGGITVAVGTRDGAVAVPPLQPGQSVVLPLR